MEPIVTVSPSDELDFVVGAGPAVVHLRNVSAQNVLYRVKTTAPGRYLVKPHQGLLPPGQEVKVYISFTPSDSPSTTNAKFQIQAACWDSGPVPDLAAALAKAQVRVHRVLQGRVVTRSSSTLQVSPTKPSYGLWPPVSLRVQRQQLESERTNLERQLKALQASALEPEPEAEYSLVYLALVLALGWLIGRYLPYALP